MGFLALENGFHFAANGIGRYILCDVKLTPSKPSAIDFDDQLFLRNKTVPICSCVVKSTVKTAQKGNCV